MTFDQIVAKVEEHVVAYSVSDLRRILEEVDETPLVIKYVPASRAAQYKNASPLWISATPALTWGTGTYVAPLRFPLSSALYGRVGLVAAFDPQDDWRVFDATSPGARNAYILWARSQPDYRSLLLTVHSTAANHAMRDRFRRQFHIDCVTFRPDQRAELHTDAQSDVWMVVTDWTPNGRIARDESKTFAAARFTVLVDEEFTLEESGLPVRWSRRMIEPVTQQALPHVGEAVVHARGDVNLPSHVAAAFHSGGYLHLWISP